MNFINISACNSDKIVRNRLLTYLLSAFTLAALYWFLLDSNWQGSANLHTAMEAVATTLALLVGAFTLKQYHSTNANVVLLVVGAGFIGTGLLDGYHMVVTSEPVIAALPSNLESLIPWSWTASRLFLAVMLVLALIACQRTKTLRNSHGINTELVYSSTLAMAILCGLYFAFIPLPRAYYPELTAHRPEEFLPGILFIIALYGFLKKGDWRHDDFEHWLILSIIVNIVAQWVFMPYSSGLFDMQFDVAHALKKVAYICALTGMLKVMYFQHYHDNRKDESSQINSSVHTVDNEESTKNKTDRKFIGAIQIGTVGKRFLFLIGFLGVFIIGSMIISQQVNLNRDVTQAMLRSLDGMATTKKLALQAKMDDYKTMLRMISSNTQLRHRLADSQRPGISIKQYKKNIELVDSILNDVLDSDSLIHNITVHNLNGDEITGVGELWLAEVDAESINIPLTENVTDMRNVNGSNIIQIIGPLQYKNKLIGAIQVWIDAKSMTVTLNGAETLGKTADSIVAFKNGSGRITLLRPLRNLPVFDKRAGRIDIDRSQYPVLRAVNGDEGVYDKGLIDHTGQPVLAALRYLPDANLGLVVRIEKSELDLLISKSLHHTLILGGIILAFALLLGWISSHLLISPLTHITKYAHKFSNQADRTEIKKGLQINTQDEFGVLATTLVQAAEDIHNRERDLISIKKRMHAVLENMQDAVFIINTNGEIQYCNPSTETILGYAPSELVNQHINVLMTESVHAKHNDYIHQHTKNKLNNIMEKDREVIAVHKDGTKVPVSIAISRIEIGDEILFTGIMHDHTQSKLYQKTLEKQNRELTAANEELEQFAYVASHDLKTPLRAIDNLVEWVIDDMQDMQLPAEVEKNLKRLQERSFFMDKMISELLSFSRAGRYTYPAEIVNIKELIAQIAFELSPPDGIRIIIDHSLPILKTPKPPLEMVLRNLISNAIKHHDYDEGCIHVTAVCDDNKVLFSVSDDGPGIEQQYHKKVFQIFQTLRPKSETNSTGMGLALVKRVVEGYGHTIRLLSDADKRGCEIEFGWPKEWQENISESDNDTESTKLKQDAA